MWFVKRACGMAMSAILCGGFFSSRSDMFVEYAWVILAEQNFGFRV